MMSERKVKELDLCNRGDERDHNDGQWTARSAGNSAVLYGTEACRAGLRTSGSSSALNSHACHACLRLRLSPVMCPACHVSCRVTHHQHVLPRHCTNAATAPRRRHDASALSV